MKTLLLFVVLFAGLSCNRDRLVYICDSHTAHRYHLQGNCPGLVNCTHRILKISLAEAEKKGRTLCGFEK